MKPDQCGLNWIELA